MGPFFLKHNFQIRISKEWFLKPRDLKKKHRWRIQGVQNNMIWVNDGADRRHSAKWGIVAESCSPKIDDANKISKNSQLDKPRLPWTMTNKVRKISTTNTENFVSVFF